MRTVYDADCFAGAPRPSLPQLEVRVQQLQSSVLAAVLLIRRCCAAVTRAKIAGRLWLQHPAGAVLL